MLVRGNILSYESVRFVFVGKPTEINMNNLNGQKGSFMPPKIEHTKVKYIF